MTAVAQPLTSFQPSTRIGWTTSGNGFGAMNSDEVSRMFTPGPRKTAQRQNSSSSISSTASSTSTISATSQQGQTNGAVQPPASAEAGSWAARKKPARGLWPPGKAEPATGISTARPQIINSATSGHTASSAISALHAPMLPSQQLANGNGQANGILREQPQAMPQAILHLIPMNGTFERKTITVPYAPDVLRIGRQTNQKTVPTPLNGYFDSKVLSRQHAEIYADRQGRIFIRDVKSSNGTFVNGMRLSQENKESEPRELREQDVLELGIDIVSEDQKTVVHHKVAAKVEHAGVYGQGNDALNFGDLDPSAGPGLMPNPHQLKRTGSQGSINSRASNPAVSQAAMGIGGLTQPQHMRSWLNPITTEHIVRKLNHEMKLAAQQSQEIARARQAIEHMLGSRADPPPPLPEKKSSSEKSRPSPTKSKLDLMAHFSEPPAPPPQAPLPEKPDVARALADPIIQPLLRRSDTARTHSGSGSPTRNDHSGDILRLCEELKLAKGELSNQSERMKNLENQLAQERTARESAEERAQRLEQPRDSPTNDGHPSADDSSISREVSNRNPDSALQEQLDRLTRSMDEMKHQMEQYRQRAESAEAERDEARQTLAEMVEQKRKENLEESNKSSKSPASSPRSLWISSPRQEPQSAEPNGHALAPVRVGSPTSIELLERAGVEEGKPITPAQVERLQQFLTQEVLEIPNRPNGPGHIVAPLTSFTAVVLLGWIAMQYMNSWPKVVDR
ncbi:cytoplasm to vacuole targeting Vps64 [Lecanosticta acicola]|uniref:Cytoplasm to vacuole targeting Vps64 n=1 Tax=Lecanosticta acicola TaxID=111012 RepID=A0AAI8W1C7_9PEZI|nr:cytoplasm to vacuole targeting Vps64 [Lecanosticta acicola]